MDSTEKDSQNDDDSCWQILSPEHATFLCLVAVRKTGGCSVKRRHHQQLYLEGTMTAMGHINRYLKLLPSTLKHLLLLSVCPPKLSGAIFLFPTIAMSSVSGCDGFCFNRNQSLAHPYLGKLPHFDKCFSNGLKPAHHSSPVFVL